MKQGGSWLAQRIAEGDVFVPEEFSEEQQMIRDSVIEFCVKEIQEPIKQRGRELSASKDLLEIVALLEKAGEYGFCGVSIAEQYGGMDLDFNTGVLFAEANAQGFSFATTIGAQTSIGSLPIVFYGSEEQKAKYLPGIASGQLKASYCLTEPGAGSDANSGKTTAVLTEDGKSYVINGQKMWITNGGFADVFIVFAKIDNDKNLSAFIVEKSYPGLSTGAEEEKLGIKGSSTVQVFFNDCLVPKENLLGERGGGFKMALNILNTGRMKLAAGGIGGSKFAHTKAIEYANQRVQFREPIANFGAIKHKLGEIAVKTWMHESALYRTGKQIDIKTQELVAEGQSASEAKINAVREYAIEAALLKFSCSEVMDYSIDEALQIYGGMGYAVETGIEMGYRDSRILRIYEGTNEINRMLSQAELGRRIAKTKELSLRPATKMVRDHIIKRIFFRGADDEATAVFNLKVAFLYLSGVVGRSMGKELVREQEIVMNMADMMAVAFVAESGWLRYNKLKEQQLVSQETLDILFKVNQVYLFNALTSAQQWGKEIIYAFTENNPRQRKRMMARLNALTTRYAVNAKNLRRDIAEYSCAKGSYPF